MRHTNSEAGEANPISPEFLGLVRCQLIFVTLPIHFFYYYFDRLLQDHNNILFNSLLFSPQLLTNIIQNTPKHYKYIEKTDKRIVYLISNYFLLITFKQKYLITRYIDSNLIKLLRGLKYYIGEHSLPFFVVHFSLKTCYILMCH